MKTNLEWAEICFILNAISLSKRAPVYRYPAIREVMGSADLPGMASFQQSFPFPTLQMNSQRYKVFGLVTNMNWAGEALIHWQRERCGKSEEAHSVMKDDFTGGKLLYDGACSCPVGLIAHNQLTIKGNRCFGGGFSRVNFHADG